MIKIAKDKANKNLQVKISRFADGQPNGTVPLEHWRSLISSLVLVGYEVYGDDDKIVFVLSEFDEVKEI